MVKVLLTGADGQFGTNFISRFGACWDVAPLLVSRCDIRDREAVRRFVAQVRPALVVHAAACTDVDGAESDPDLAYAVNALGSRNVAQAAEEAGAWVIALSTDYVFSGELVRAYHEFDEPDPRTVYGRSKLAGEQAVRAFCRRHTVVRTAWLYGGTGNNFPARIARLARERAASGVPLRVVDDQRGNPTSAAALSALIHGLLRDPVPGVVHGSCEGAATWFDFARRVVAGLKINAGVEPCASAEFPRPASRPANSALDKMVLRLERRPPMPGWEESLDRWMEENRHALV